MKNNLSNGITTIRTPLRRIGYMSNGGGASYTINVTSSTGYFAVKDASNGVTIYASGSRTIPATNSISFWACNNGSDATESYSGKITLLWAMSQNITSIDVSNLIYLTQFRISGNVITTLNCNGQASTLLINASNNFSLSSISVRGCNKATSLDISNTLIASDGLFLDDMKSLTTMTVRGASCTATVDQLNKLYAKLPFFSSGTHNLLIGAGAPAGSDGTIASARGWSIGV